MKRLVLIACCLVLLLAAILIGWRYFPPAGQQAGATPVQVVLLGVTNEPARGKCARFMITNNLENDILYGQTIEVKTQSGWPKYPSGSRLPHSSFVALEAQDSVTLMAAAPTNGATWRVSVLYQHLQTRRGQDRFGMRTAIANKLRPGQQYLGEWVESREIKE